MQTHYFIALALPFKIKQQLAKHYSNVASQLPFKKAVHELDYHITLAFLGNQDESILQQLMLNLELKLKSVKPITLTIDGYGTFGSDTSPRIFWNRLEPNKALFDLQQIVSEQCQSLGIQLESRPYNPHITIARKWAGEKNFDSTLLEQLNPLKEAPITFLANEVVLYRTNLASIIKYENIFSVVLLN